LVLSGAYLIFVAALSMVVRTYLVVVSHNLARTGWRAQT